MRILITGIAGFIGSHLAEALTSKSHEICGIDNLSTGKLSNLHQFVIGDELKLKFHDGNICDKDLINMIFEVYRPEIVVHAAASYKDPDDWVEDARTNVEGTAIVCKYCKKYDVKLMIYLQTSLVYGMPGSIGTSIPFHPYDPFRPVNNSYAITKAAAEQIIKVSGVPYISFRLANIYGPRNLSGPIPTFYKRMVNHERCTVVDTRRDFIYINDLIDLLSRTISIWDQCPMFVRYNVSSGRDYPIEVILHHVMSEMGIDVPYDKRKRFPDDVDTILLDSSRTGEIYGWKAVTRIEDGIRKTVQWYRDNEVKETYTHLREGK